MDTASVRFEGQRTGGVSDAPELYCDIGVSATNNQTYSDTSWAGYNFDVDISGEATGWRAVVISIDSGDTTSAEARAVTLRIT